jgi:hypothetical protein
MSTNHQTQTPIRTDDGARIRFQRISAACDRPLSPSAHWCALAAYASELADVFGFTEDSRSIRKLED